MDTPASTPPDTDPDLLKRAQGGDEQAFGELMTTHYEPVFRLVMSIVRNEHDARDICQEVWLRIWRKLPDFRGESKFTTWLHPIAVRRAFDHLRKRRRWYDRFLPLGAMDAATGKVPEPSTGDVTRGETEQADRIERFNCALATLPPLHRTVLALREVQGLSYEEIANAANIPVGTVMSRLHHARRLLAQTLKKSP